MIDYHIHTNHSIDAEGKLEDYCLRAMEIGLQEICFTNHCELDPARDDSYIRFDGRWELFRRAGLLRIQQEILEQKEYFKQRGLIVRFGLEVGYYPGIEPFFQDLTRGIEFDFLLGSIHCLDHICIDSSKEYEEYFSQHSAQELIHNYFQAVMDLVNSGLFNALGHLDVYKKYGIKYYQKEINAFSESQVMAIFKKMNEKEIALEINTAGMRRIGQFYPSKSLLKLAKKAGLNMITIGSDAHRIEDLGKDLANGIEYLKSAGFDAVYKFIKQKPVRMPL